MLCLFSERSSPCHWLQKDHASLGGHAVRSDAAAGNSSSCQAAHQEEGASFSAAPLQMRRQFLSSAGFKPSQKGLKFLLSEGKSKVKGQENPKSTEHVEHHHGAQSDAQINFLLLLTHHYHHHREKQRVPHFRRETEELPAP